MSSRNRDNRKQRIESIVATTSQAVNSIEVCINPDGTIKFATKMSDVVVRTEYERQKGPKILNETPVMQEHIPFNPNEALADYDAICAIDTNTQAIGGHNISITGIVLGQWTDVQRDQFVWSVPYCLKLPSRREHPERMGWFFAIKQLMHDAILHSHDKVAIVVDSCKGQLPDFNARRLPLIGTAILPPNMTLLYASSDTGSEYATNCMIREADRVSGMVMKELSEGRFPLNQLLVSDPSAVTKINGSQSA